MTGWTRVCRLDDVPAGGLRRIAVDGGTALLCRVGEAEVFVVEDLCTHDDGPLNDGRLYGTALECPRHGARFDVTTGAVLRLPAASPLRTYVARLRDGWVEVAAGGTPC